MGETVEGVHARTAGFLDAFLRRLTAEGDIHKRILFVGHAASVITLGKELVGDRDMPFRVGCCSLTTLVPKAGRVPPDGGNASVGEWEITGKAEAEFLTNGVERDWGFEDIEVDKGQVVNDPGDAGTENEVEEPGSFGLQVQLDDGNTGGLSRM